MLLLSVVQAVVGLEYSDEGRQDGGHDTALGDTALYRMAPSSIQLTPQPGFLKPSSTVHDKNPLVKRDVLTDAPRRRFWGEMDALLTENIGTLW